MPVFLNTDNSLDNQTQDYQIEGTPYKITAYWNTRSGWYIDIRSEDDEAILTGLKVMPDGNLTWRYSRLTGLFQGDLWVVDTEYDPDDLVITRDNFGQDKRFRLTYFTQDEMETYNINPRS